MLTINIILFILGLFLLSVGAEKVVEGSLALAMKFHVPKVIIGMTLVAFATSAPELAVSLAATFDGATEMAVGNVIGSCILNTLLVLGIIGIIMPIYAKHIPIRREATAFVLIALITFGFSLTGHFESWHGIILLALMVPFLWLQTGMDPDHEAKEPITEGSLFWGLTWTILGGVMLWMGSDWMVMAAVYFGAYFGLSEAFIGLTIVAVGTSLPEIATSLAANKKQEHEIALANIIGSNIFNILFVLGMAASLSPAPMVVSTNMQFFDIPIMIAAGIIFLMLVFRGHLSRLSGLMLVGLYAAYTTVLILQNT